LQARIIRQSTTRINARPPRIPPTNGRTPSSSSSSPSWPETVPPPFLKLQAIISDVLALDAVTVVILVVQVAVVNAVVVRVVDLVVEEVDVVQLVELEALEDAVLSMRLRC
jgi:hypothetical protein